MSKRAIIALFFFTIFFSGYFIYTNRLKPQPTDNAPLITSIIIENTHHDPDRIRRDHTFYFDFTMEAIDDNGIKNACVVITSPDANQTIINLVEVSGSYSDSFQALHSGNYTFIFKVVDTANQTTVIQASRSVVYSTNSR
jgi:hypothetical protein